MDPCRCDRLADADERRSWVTENRPWCSRDGSAGWILHEPGGSTSSAVALAAADEALYRAKRLGRNCAVSAERPERMAIPA
jgi:GGDEF domain-containing protein